MHRRLLIFILVLLSLPVVGQEYEISLKHWDTKDGLSHRLVLGVFQDRKGFIWACTKNGLNRFDGNNFTVYTKEKDKLPYNNYAAIVEDPGGAFWLLGSEDYDNNLVIFDPLTKKAQTFNEKTGYKEIMHINFLQQMQDSVLFFGHQNEPYFFTWHYRTGLHKISYPVPVRTLITHTENGTFWVQSKAGDLCEINMLGKLVGRRYTPFYLLGLRSDWPSRGMFLPSKGLFLKDSVTKKIIKISPGMKMEIVSGKLPALDNSLEDVVFNTGVDDIIYRQGKVFHPKLGLLKDFIKDGEPELRANLRQVIIDNKDRIWMGNDYGLYMLSVTRNRFKKYFYQDIKKITQNSYRSLVVDNGCLYAANEATGVKQTNIIGATGKSSVFASQPVVRSYETLIKTKEGTLFGMVNRFLYKFEKRSNAWSYTSLPPEMAEYRYWNIYQVAKDSFLLGTNMGLIWFRLSDQTFSPFTAYHKFDELAKALVLDIIRDRKGQEWICSNTGLYKYDVVHGVTARYSSADSGAHFLPAAEFQHLYLDTDGIYWIATTKGLIKWDIAQNKYRLYTHEDGLSNNNIYSVYDDGLGRIWMGSDYGIMQFNKATDIVNTYLTGNGVTHNEFNRVSHTRDSAGNIYFGTLNGVTAFNPADFIRDSFKERSSPLVVTSFEQYNGRTNHIEDRTPSLLSTNTITLNPNDRFFNISFALLTYTDAVHTIYYWKVDGMDSGWSSIKTPTLRLSGLPYGKRMLHVKAQASDGKWGANELHFQLIVVKPFYLRTLFIVIVVLVLVIVIVLGYRWRVFNLRKENARLDKIVTEKTATLEHTINDLKTTSEQKDVLMKEINHRVKNNLQVISTLLNLQLAKIKDPAARVSIEESISRISSIALIHQSLYRGNELTAIEISDFAKELLQQVSTVYHNAEQNMILQNNIPKTWFDIDTALPLGLILNELMTNSYKYAYNTTGDCTIILDLKHTGGHYVLEYCDNGPGIPDDFDFAKADSLGMVIIKSLSKQLGGDFVYVKADNCFYIHFNDAEARKSIE